MSAFACLLIVGMLTPSATAGPREPVVEGIHVPWAVGGQRINEQGQLENYPGDWPDAPVQALRLWDTRTAWLNLEPARGQWDFTTLDAHLEKAKAHGVKDITLVLWGTPHWAAVGAFPTDASWLGPGSASPVKDIHDWEDYIRKTVQHCKGQVSSYELGNEPNSKVFWQGTPQQLADMVTRAARIIREEDPKALIIAPAPALNGSGMSSAIPYWKALTAAGASVDIIGVHWYPKAADPEGLIAAMKKARETLVGTSLSGKPIWVTEAGYRTEGAKKASTLIPRTMTAARLAQVQRVYWYAWCDLPIGDLLPLHTGTELAKGLQRL